MPTVVLLTITVVTVLLTFLLVLAMALFLAAECREVQASLNRLYCQVTKLKMSQVPGAKPESWEEAATAPGVRAR